MLISAKRFGILFGFWLALTLADPSALFVGALAAAAATALSLRLMPAASRRVRLLAAVRLVPGFVWGSLKGGVDVAWRALHPARPIAPVWLHYQVTLPPGAARVTLGNEFSLMPGALVAGGCGDVLYVHCLDAGQPVAEQLAEEERRIAATLETAGGESQGEGQAGAHAEGRRG